MLRAWSDRVCIHGGHHPSAVSHADIRRVRPDHGAVLKMARACVSACGPGLGTACRRREGRKRGACGPGSITPAALVGQADPLPSVQKKTAGFRVIKSHLLPLFCRAPALIWPPKVCSARNAEDDQLTGEWMKEQDIAILGVCRFSMLGRGDWKAYRNQTDDALEAIYAEKATELFAAERMEARLATFEHLTLAAMAAQSDQRFQFLVIASDRMPAEYQRRLAEVCGRVEQVVLRFVAPMHVSEAITLVAAELDLVLPDTVQFRLDDDDCVSRDFIRRLRRHAAGMWRNAHFAVSFPSIYYCVTDGPTEGIYNWYSPFFSAGAAVRHSSRTVFDYGHYKIPQHLVSVTDPHFPCIVTHRGDNDTPRHEAQILRKRGMSIAAQDHVQRAFDRHFGYLGPEGLSLSTFDRFVDPDAALAKKDSDRDVA